VTRATARRFLSGPRRDRVGFNLVQRRQRLFAVLFVASTLPACRAASVKQHAVSQQSDCRSPTAIAPALVSTSVNWIVAPDPRERPYLDRWCAGVGPIVSASRADTNPEKANTSSLVLVTWNTHIGAGDIPGLVRDLRSGLFTNGTPVDHFVLLLQEVYRSGAEVPNSRSAARPRVVIHTVAQSAQRRIDIVETARDLGLELFYVPSMSNGRPASSKLSEDRGNAILSSLPMRDLTAIELPFEAQRRVVAAATVSGTTPAGKPWALRLVNVHLDNKSRPSRLLKSLGGGRTRQARALVEVLGNDSATVVGGDINTWSMGFMEGAVGVLEQYFPIPAKHPTEPTFAIGGMRLDRLMFRLPSHYTAETRRLADRRGSDHHPLIGTIRFSE